MNNIYHELYINQNPQPNYSPRVKYYTTHTVLTNELSTTYPSYIHCSCPPQTAPASAPSLHQPAALAFSPPSWSSQHTAQDYLFVSDELKNMGEENTFNGESKLTKRIFISPT